MPSEKSFARVSSQRTDASAWTALLFVPCFALAAYIFAFRLWHPYSYWLDELSSVSASNQGIHRLMELLLADVHPPLYQFTLKVWISIFGDGEVACRTMSALLAVLSACFMWAFVRRHFTPLPRWVALLVLCTNTLFLYYANEARPYAMTCMMATVAITAYLDRPTNTVSWKLLLALWGLSLSHYFGLILAGLMVLFCLWEVRRDRSMVARVVATGSACLLWPIGHACFGSLLNMTGGNFWIEVHGIRDTLSIAASNFLPRAQALGPAVVVLLGLGAWIAGSTRQVQAMPTEPSTSVPLHLTLRRLGSLLVASLTTVSLIDLWTPISTDRNYIVMLPLFALLAAACSSCLLQWHRAMQWPISLVVAAYALACLQIGHAQLIKKSAPLQDWKAAAQAAVERSPQATFYVTNPDKEFIWRPLIAAHYVSKFAKHPVKVQSYIPGVTVLQRPAIVLSGHDQRSPASMWERLRAEGAQTIFPPDGKHPAGYAPAAWFVPVAPPPP